MTYNQLLSSAKFTCYRYRRKERKTLQKKDLFDMTNLRKKKTLEKTQKTQKKEACASK
ncbi:hypothetical protein FTV88_1359 [Heliorestis convoluta]|uniref:Uncharacterized protein n=1 Tax=Heliorestis convoluta TaxID=356322 RepID=A0A5Q2N1M8_9FIRM|nr:hypothetical protein FTV88_1359 [Heliorestis convoluta]